MQTKSRVLCNIAMILLLRRTTAEQHVEDDEVDDGEGGKDHGVHGHVTVPVDPGGVGTDEGELVQHHEPAQDVEWRQPSSLVRPRQLMPNGQDEDEHDDHQGPRERAGVEVEEHHVAGVAGLPEDGVAGEVAAFCFLPDSARGAEPSAVRHRGHQRRQQKEVLAEAVLPWQLVVVTTEHRPWRRRPRLEHYHYQSITRVCGG
jgi:hypothetical protein